MFVLPSCVLCVCVDPGVTVSRIDESSFRIFAPNPDAMTEAKEMMDKFMEDRVSVVFLL